jgi:hypothetical protein
MKMYRLVYEYMYGAQFAATIGFFDDRDKAIEAWNKCFNREGLDKKADPNDPYSALYPAFHSGSVDDSKLEYTFSCCGWREWYRVEEFEHDNTLKGYGGGPSRLNTVDYKIKDALKALVDAEGSLRRFSLNYSEKSPDYTKVFKSE